MAVDPRKALPKRFQPFLQQALSQAELRYGAQESGLASLLGQLTRNYGRDVQSQQTANASLLGSLQGASTNLNKVYNDVGLGPTVLSQIAGTNPSYARLAGELASGQAGIQQQQLGAEAGGQYLLNHLRDNYGDQVQQVSDQNQALTKERGVYVADQLSQLIAGDRSGRSQANAAARKQAHDDQQAELDRIATQGNALIGQGLVVGEDGSLTPLPGGKADPNAPSNRPKRTTGPGTAPTGAQREAGTSFQRAVALARGMTKGLSHTPEVEQSVTANLTSGRPGSPGKVVYENVPVLDAQGRPKETAVLDAQGRPKKDKDGNVITKVVTKRQPKLDGNGQQVTGSPQAAVPAFDQPIAQAATEMALYGFVSTKTVQALQKLGYSVRQFPGLVTENQHRAATPKSPTTQRTKPKTTNSIRDLYG